MGVVLRVLGFFGIGWLVSDDSRNSKKESDWSLVVGVACNAGVTEKSLPVSNPESPPCESTNWLLGNDAIGSSPSLLILLSRRVGGTEELVSVVGVSSTDKLNGVSKKSMDSVFVLCGNSSGRVGREWVGFHGNGSTVVVGVVFPFFVAEVLEDGCFLFLLSSKLNMNLSFLCWRFNPKASSASSIATS